MNSWAAKIFSPEIRAYFDVDTDTVRNKIIKLLVPFKEFSFEYCLCLSKRLNQKVRTVPSHCQLRYPHHVLHPPFGVSITRVSIEDIIVSRQKSERLRYGY
jgi:hypothetical protein